MIRTLLRLAPILLCAPACAADIEALSIPGIKAAMDRIVPAFEATGHRVAMTFEILAGQKQRIESGRFDVAIFARAQMDDLARSGKLRADSLRDIARTSIGVVVKKGAAVPPMKDVEDFKRALRAAKSVTYTKESATGAYITGLLDRLGLAAELKDKLILQPGGDMTTPAVAEGRVELGIVLVSDILRNPAAQLVAPLPPEIQNYVVQTAGAAAGSRQADAASAFIAFLARPESKKAFADTGLEPAP